MIASMKRIPLMGELSLDDLDKMNANNVIKKKLSNASKPIASIQQQITQQLAISMANSTITDSSLSLDSLNLPKEILDRLFVHQREGVQWLHGLYNHNKGGILGDGESHITFPLIMYKFNGKSFSFGQSLKFDDAINYITGVMHHRPVCPLQAHRGCLPFMCHIYM